MKKLLTVMAFAVTHICVVLGMDVEGETSLQSEQKNLATLNLKIKALEDLLIQQDKLTPLDATCFVKPDTEPLVYYKDIMVAYRPFFAQDAKKLHVEAYGSLARTLLGFVKKRALYRKCLNAAEVTCTPEEIEAYMDCLRNGKDYPSSLIETIISKIQIEPIIDFITDQSEIETREEGFLKYFTAFEEEIQEKINAKKANYQWFMMFSDQLSVLTSKLLYRSFANINTKYPVYFEYVDRKNDFPNFSKKKYLTSVARINHVMSLPGLTNQFPAVFIMPYPFILEPIDFLNLVAGSDQLFWPCGMVFGPVMADGWYHCPRNFYGHDWHHLGIILASMLSPCLFNETKETILDNLSLFSDILFCSQNSFILYCLLQKELNKLIKDIPDPDTRKIFSFFAFEGSHEYTYTISMRFRCMTGKGGRVFEDHAVYYNLNYYKSLYPYAASELNNVDLGNYLQCMWDQYREFCDRHISPDLNKFVDLFLTRVPKNIGFHYLVYTIDMNGTNRAFVGGSFNSHYEFVFKKVCTSSAEMPSIMHLLYSPPFTINADEAQAYVWRGNALYKTVKEEQFIPSALLE